MRRLTEAQKGELDQLMVNADGLLHPATVVAFAEDPATALHTAFEWDDTAAAIAHRLQQARQVLALYVEVIPHTETRTRAFVSLESDRVEEGGYRRIVDVLGNAEQREELLEQALADLRRWEEKYATLRALSPIFAARRRVSRHCRRARSRSSR